MRREGRGRALILKAIRCRVWIIPSSIDPFELCQLSQTESRPNIIEAEIESEFGHIVVTRPAVFPVPAVHSHSVGPQQAYMSGEFRIRGRNHAAFSGRDVLVSEETEATRGSPGTAGAS